MGVNHGRHAPSRPLRWLFVVFLVLEACDGFRLPGFTEGFIDAQMGDRDGDGWRDCGIDPSVTCDCDDADPSVYPGSAGASLAPGEYVDLDGDGFGTESQDRCVPGWAGRVSQRGDCEDLDVTVYAGADDSPDDGIDQDCGGTDGPDPHVRLTSSDFLTIQKAIDAAVDGNTLWIGLPAGASSVVFKENVAIRAKRIALITTRPGFITIDGQGAGPTLILQDIPDADEGELQATVDGFILQNGLVSCDSCEESDTDDDGGGLRILRSSPLIRRCLIRNNHAAHKGGGVYIDDSSPTLEDCRILGNDASDGGGIAVVGPESHPQIRHTRIGECAEASDGNFGTVENSRIDCNATYGNGGGIALQDSHPALLFSRLERNTASYGGGVFTIGATVPELRHLLIRGSVAGHAGGGMLIDGSSPILSHCVITGNRAPSDDNFEAASGGGLLIIATDSKLYATPGIESSILSDNNTDSSEAGGTVFNLAAMDGADLDGISNTDLYSDDPDFNIFVGGAGSCAHLSCLSPNGQNMEIDPGLPQTGDDLHLARTSGLIDRGTGIDPDGSPADPGLYGGEDGDRWDLDGDGYFDWFWPDAFIDAPARFDPADYDCDDLDASVPMVTSCTN
jgi:hypothetical protein